MEKFNQAEFESKAKKMVASYYDIDEKDVFMVWFSKVGLNAKAMLSSDLDSRYFEITYFGEKGQYIMTVHTYNDDEELQMNEKQKSCPYCHPPYKPFISDGKGTFIDLENNSSPICVGISNVLGEGPITEALCEVVNVLKLPSCPFCKRDLRSNEK